MAAMVMEKKTKTKQKKQGICQEPTVNQVRVKAAVPTYKIYKKGEFG